MALPWTPEEALKGAQLLSRALKCSPSPETPGFTYATDLSALFDEGADRSLAAEDIPLISNGDSNEQETFPIDDSVAANLMGSQDNTQDDNNFADEDTIVLPETDMDFRTSGRFLCLEAGRRTDQGDALQSVDEGLSNEEEQEEFTENESHGLNSESAIEGFHEEPTQQESEAASAALDLEGTIGGSHEEPTHQESDAETAALGLDTAMAKMAQYMQSTEAAAARAAEAQARVQKFLADKSHNSVSAPTLTKPRTPVVLKRDR
jgi:hypothetical protein